MTAAAPPAPPLGPWSPLRLRVFRGLWIAGFVSNIGTTMHTVGAGWAITDLSDSPAIVSLVQTAWAIPGFIFAVPAGVFADVIDRRKLLLVCQVTAMLFAAALGVLEMTDQLDVPMLLTGTFLLSIVLTMAGPPFMALIPDLVGPEELTQAIGLNNISYNGSQSVGPALAGVVIAAAGAGAVFMLNAVSFLGIVFVLWRYRPERPGPTSDERAWDAMRTGFRYFRDRPILRRYAWRIMLAFITTSSMVALLPAVARTRLDTSAGEFGMLAAGFGVGAVLAVWLLPRVRHLASPDGLVFGSALVWAVGAAVVGLTTWLPLAVLGVLLTGAAAMATMNITYSMFMLLLPAWIRGRASSVVMLMVWLGASIGGIGWGAAANAIGIGEALLVAAASHVLIAAAITRWMRLAPEQPHA
ncbi:MAG: MFS transporter [Actinobacteria bacterium]|nr:MFS transporter [Actinomycetota bacterium]